MLSKSLAKKVFWACRGRGAATGGFVRQAPLDCFPLSPRGRSCREGRVVKRMLQPATPENPIDQPHPEQAGE